MSDDPNGGELGPGTATTPSAPAQPADWAQARKAEQAPRHTPPPTRQPTAPSENSRATNRQRPYGLDASSRYANQAEERRAEAARLEASRRAATSPDPGTAPPAPPAAGEKFRFGDFELTATEIKELAAHKGDRGLAPADAATEARAI